ncbi:MAG: hypothetical protein C3F07_03790 [Anaerolineales bacterium]|nr:MAG: hypothetical protein C3F07_03790 [Anaerolineales bacterium]
MFKGKLLSMVLLAGMLLGQTVPHAMAATYCDHAQFVSDITAPDGAAFAPGAAFTKTWRFMNIGTCTWTTSYSLVWAGGDALGAPASVKLPVDVPPGQMLDISVNLTAPNAAGHYKGLFKFSNASGTQFGIGDSAGEAFWVDINVVATDAVIYDFVANAAYAQWKSGAGPIPYPGASGDRRGFSYQVDKPHLEDDSFDSLPGLLTVPQNKYNGYIQATYPEFQIQQGDKLQTLVNCEFGATGCYVTFRIDYLLPNNVQRTLWSFKEAYDKRFYRANIDLSPLAGQRVRFVFMLLSTGYASGDRAIWGSPRIVRAGTIQPPAPPATLTPLPPLTPTQTPITPPPPTVAPSGCDRAIFITDVNVPDGTTFAPGAAFSKTWRLKNSGSCTWTTAYKLMYYSGEQMGAPTSINIPWNVYYGQTVDLTVNMVAPGSPGQYRGFWILTNASGSMFGIGSNAADPFWVEINVAGEAPQEGGYNFWLNACSAQWKSGAGPLPCPGAVGDRNGFVIADNFSHLEDGTMGPAPSLLMAPQNKYNGYIQGFYPTFTVRPGDRFRAVIGCEYGSSCYVTFRLDYMNPNGYIGTFWQWREQNDGKNYTADVDLTPLAGRSVRFILTILATGSATGDLVRWGAPTIIRKEGTTPPTITPMPPTITVTPSMNDWLTFTNVSYGFQFKYPPASQIENGGTDNITYIDLPITPGTNLDHKYLEMVVADNPGYCQSPLATSSMLQTTETVIVNGLTFLKQTGQDGTAGHINKWTAYSTQRGNACVSLDFVLRAADPGVFTTPPPLYDEAAESAVFGQIVSTFAWLTVPPTPTFTPVPPTLTPIPPTVTPGPPAASPTIKSLYMNDAMNGWALSDQYVLRTYDGGSSWYVVLFESNPPSGYFPSSTKAWVISNAFEIIRTTDGGATWTRYATPFNGGSVQFLDDNTGYVFQITGAAMQKQSVVLYKTTDGGATWTKNYDNDPTVPGSSNTLPLGGHKAGITFSTATTGWVGGDTPTDGYFYFYKTTDSGVTWSRLQLAIPAGYESAYISTTAPKFFDASNGVLPVWMTIGIGMRDLFLYVTHDGGNTWTPSPAFARSAEHTEIITMNNTISWDWANIFHVTNDGGNTWATITPDVTFGDGFRELDFVSTMNGWARLQLDDGHTALYRTTDGGSTWTLLYGHVTPTPTPDPAAFAQTIVNTLNARNFDALPAMMDTSLGFAYWQSQGTSYPADQAIESLRTGLSVTLIPDPNKDLNSLLGGLNPYAIMGLDPAKSYGLFISGWGSDTKTEVILYVTQRADGSLYWHSVLIAPTGFITPTTLIGPYAVVNVAVNDVLNIRSGAGVNQNIIGYYPSDATDVMRTGPSTSVDGAVWVEVRRNDGLTGWVNSNFLTEYVTHEAFCADTRILPLIEQAKQSMNQSNGSLLGQIVSPVHGVNMHLWAYGPGINFTQATAADIYTSGTVYNWGGGPSGTPDTGTFNAVLKPKYLEVFNAPNMETYCDDLTKVFNLSRPWPYPNIRYYNLYKPGSSQFFDFRTLLIGIEYINNQPYIYGMVTIIWEP